MLHVRDLLLLEATRRSQAPLGYAASGTAICLNDERYAVATLANTLLRVNRDLCRLLCLMGPLLCMCRHHRGEISAGRDILNHAHHPVQVPARSYTQLLVLRTHSRTVLTAHALLASFLLSA